MIRILSTQCDWRSDEHFQSLKNRPAGRKGPFAAILELLSIRRDSMSFSHTISNTRYVFNDLRELLAKATPLRSGDMLAGLAAQSAQERVAAQCALADLPLDHFLSEQVIPYEIDE